MTRKKAAKTGISFTHVNSGGECRHGTAAGIHINSRQMLVTWDDGTQEYWEAFRDEWTLRQLGPAEADLLRRLHTALVAAQDAWTAFLNAHSLALGALLRKELARTVDGLMQQDEDTKEAT